MFKAHSDDCSINMRGIYNSHWEVCNPKTNKKNKTDRRTIIATMKKAKKATVPL
ncbi:MAG: hypothetical protein AAGE99_02800 [Chlamydiota bacterium]